MQEIFFYIFAALAGGIVAEINSKKGIKQTSLTPFFVRGFTSILIGVIFGCLFEAVTGNVKLTVAIAGIAGLGGFQSLEWIAGLVKSAIEKAFKK